MMAMMLTHLVTIYAELYCQFMYTKRMFEWEVKDYSYFTMVQVFGSQMQTDNKVYMFVEIHNSSRYFCLQHLLPQPEPE